MLLQTLHPVKEYADRGMEVERRVVVRYLCDREVSYYAPGTRERIRARARNISVQGIGLLVDAPLEPGTHLVIKMRIVSPATSLSLVVRVIHAIRQEEGSWIVGCKFLTRPSAEYVLALL